MTVFTWRLGVSMAALIFAQAAAAQTTADSPASPAPSSTPVPAASDVASPANDSSADIVVTATRRSERLRDVPMTVDVATGQQLQRLQILDFKDVSQLAPGLDLTNTVGRNNTATLRGVSYDPDSGSSPAVDLYFNEVPVNAMVGFTALYDIDQIEVLRGPQGALRGRTSPAGAITIRTRRPTMDGTNGYLQVTGTDRNAYNVQGGVTLPLIPGTLSMRVAGLVDGNRLNGVRDISKGDEFSRSRTMSGRLSLAWTPTANLSVNLMYQYLNEDNRQFQQVFGPGNAAIGNAPISLSDRIGVSEGDNRTLVNSHLETLDATWDLGPVSLNLVAGRQDGTILTAVAADVGNAIHNYDVTNVVRAPIGNTTAELRLSSNGNGFFNWTLGGYFDRADRTTAHVSIASDFIGGIPGVPTPIVIVPVPGDLTITGAPRTYALNGSVRLQFTRQLKLEAALRYTSIRTQSVANLSIPSVGLVVPIANADITNHPLTGSASLTYKVSPALTVYAAYGRSFRPPSPAVGSPQNISPDLSISKPETSNSFEIGAKTDFLDHKLALDVDAFYQKFNGFISRFNNIPVDQGTNSDVTGDGVPDGVFLGPPDGAVDTVSGFTYNGNAVVKGVEATLTGRPTEFWDFSVAVSYAHARYTNALLPCLTLDAAGNQVVVPNAAFGGANNVSFCKRNSRLADTPDFTLTANSEIRFPIGDYQPFLRGLVAYRPSVYSETADYRYRARETVNLFVGVRGPQSKWEADIFVKNLLDQDRVTATNANNASYNGTSVIDSSAIIYDSGYRFANTTSPREFGASLSFKF